MQSDTEQPLLQPQSVAIAPAAGATKVRAPGKYTCPMHPEVQADKPGSCPKCGMALEPVDLSATTDRVEYVRCVRWSICRPYRGLRPYQSIYLLAIQQLRQEGIRVVMVTGDNHTTAAAVAKKLGIDFEADVLPEKKAEVVKKLQSQGRIVAMAGDGVNDAPALVQAHVGIAMGTGTDAAMETGGITLVKGDLRGIVKARRLSQRTMSNIRQNLFFAFFYNALGVPLAAGVLYPIFGLLLNPMIAAAAMSFSSVSVIGNSLRLRTAKL